MALTVSSQGFSWVHEFENCVNASFYDTAGLTCSPCSINEVCINILFSCLLRARRLLELTKTCSVLVDCCREVRMRKRIQACISKLRFRWIHIRHVSTV